MPKQTVKCRLEQAVFRLHRPPTLRLLDDLLYLLRYSHPQICKYDANTVLAAVSSAHRNCPYSPIEDIHRHAMCFSLKFPVNLSFRPSVWVNNTNGLKSWNSLITHFLQLKKGNNVTIFHFLMLSDAKTDPV